MLRWVADERLNVDPDVNLNLNTVDLDVDVRPPRTIDVGALIGAGSRLVRIRSNQ